MTSLVSARSRHTPHRHHGARCWMPDADPPQFSSTGARRRPSPARRSSRAWTAPPRRLEAALAPGPSGPVRRSSTRSAGSPARGCKTGRYSVRPCIFQQQGSANVGRATTILPRRERAHSAPAIVMKTPCSHFSHAGRAPAAEKPHTIVYQAKACPALDAGGDRLAKKRVTTNTIAFSAKWIPRLRKTRQNTNGRPA